MAFRVFGTLQDPWWERQPDESLTAYTRFCRYRDRDAAALDDDGERSLRKLAESFRVSDRAVREQAKSHRWSDRVAAFEDWERRARRERHDRKLEQAAERLANVEIAAASEMVHLLRMSVRSQIESGTRLEPAEVPRVADAAVKLGQAATRAPDSARAIYRAAETSSGHGGSSVNVVEVDLPEFRGLSADAQRERVIDMLASLQRFNAYATREDSHQHNDHDHDHDHDHDRTDGSDQADLNQHHTTPGHLTPTPPKPESEPPRGGTPPTPLSVREIE